MVRKSKKQRNEEQRVRQDKLRDSKRDECRAERDDMARALLWIMIRETLREKDPRKALDLLRDSVVTELEIQGFHVKHAEDDFEALAARYAAAFARGLTPFRPKPHLKPKKAPSGNPTSGSPS